MSTRRVHRAEELLRAYDEIDDLDELFERPSRRQKQQRSRPRREESNDQKRRRRLRGGVPSEPFKCRRCKAFIGAPPSGGRHRNHCPACLCSLHVDLKTPGDRACECRSLMEPVGTAFRRGDQLVVHCCLGCGVQRHNRIAADDNPLLLMRLPLIELWIDDQSDDEGRLDVIA